MQRSVVLSEEMWAKLQRKADIHQSSVNQVIRDFLREAIDANPDMV